MIDHHFDESSAAILGNHTEQLRTRFGYPPPQRNGSLTGFLRNYSKNPLALAFHLISGGAQIDASAAGWLDPHPNLRCVFIFVTKVTKVDAVNVEARRPARLFIRPALFTHAHLLVVGCM